MFHVPILDDRGTVDKLLRGPIWKNVVFRVLISSFTDERLEKELKKFLLYNLYGSENSDNAYFILVEDSNILEGYKELRFMTGHNFDSLKGEMGSINFMLAPDEFHPVKFKIKGSDVEILAPAVEVDGISHLLYKADLDGRLKLLFKGGIFEKTGAGFFFK